MDRILKQQFDAITQDRLSGAAELAIRACNALNEWLRQNSEPGLADLREIAETLFCAQPSMAPFIQLANRVALAADSKSAAARLRPALASLRSAIQTGGKQIATKFRKSLGPDRRYGLCTYSYSSTVLKAILGGKDQIPWVACSESRPRLEGRKMAEDIASAGIEVRFFVDSALPSYLQFCSALIIGADAISEDGFLNKKGTDALVSKALELHKPVWVLADTSKFEPTGIVAVTSNRTFLGKHNEEVWANPPARIMIFNDYFEEISLRRGIRVLCERGWQSRIQIARQIGANPLSPQIRRVFLDWIDNRERAT